MNLLEKEILGCILKDNSLINETNININHFQSESSKLLFQSMLVLASRGDAIDQVTLMAENYDYIQDLGGVNFITELKSIGDVNNFETYERRFIEQYKERESKNIVANWMSNKNANTNDLITKLQEIEDAGIIEEESNKDVIAKMKELPFSSAPTNRGVPSGLRDLDKFLGGFRNTESYIIGARPSMGKTALMLYLALSAIKSGAVPLIFSLEMSKESLTMRLFSMLGNINTFLAQDPQSLTNAQKENWKSAGETLEKLDFEIYDSSMQTIPYMRSQIRKAKRKYEGKQVVVFIDYLTLIEYEGKYNNEKDRVTEISKGLKNMARDYDCPAITLAQLSRAVEQRQDKRPMMSDLRESGGIEQDADGIIFLYRDSYYNPENDSNELEIILAKHRNGPTGTATVYYNKATGKIGDLSNDY